MRPILQRKDVQEGKVRLIDAEKLAALAEYHGEEYADGKIKSDTFKQAISILESMPTSLPCLTRKPQPRRTRLFKAPTTYRRPTAKRPSSRRFCCSDDFSTIKNKEGENYERKK